MHSTGLRVNEVSNLQQSNPIYSEIKSPSLGTPIYNIPGYYIAVLSSVPRRLFCPSVYRSPKNSAVLSNCKPNHCPGSIMGRKLPTIMAGLYSVSGKVSKRRSLTHILYISRLTVNEKQHRISGSFEFGSGFLRAQLVKIAFCVVSNAICPNFSQYDTSDVSAMIS